MEHFLTRILIISDVTLLISKKFNVSLEIARDMFYSSKTCKTLFDSETGLYGEAPYRTFQLFLKEFKNTIKK